MIDQELYKTRVKLVDEFIARFNREEYHPDLKKGGPDSDRTNLLLLFDSHLFKSKSDPLFTKAQRMVDDILTKNTLLDYASNTWLAKATCQGSFRGKPTRFDLYLTVENMGDEVYKWVITKAEGDIFKLTPPVISDEIMLMPDAHETNFMALHRITTEQDNLITNYRIKDAETDQTSIFFAYVYNGLLDIPYVEELEFLFFQVPGWRFAIHHLDRDESNAGWLITSFCEMSDTEKGEFLTHIYK